MRTNGTVRGTVAVLSLMMMPAAAHAQCPGGARQLGDIGITQLECDCVIAPPTAEAQWQFMTEPGIARVESGSPADGRLRAGDVIMAVNGEAITTPAGAAAFARLHPTQPVALTVRRSDGTHNFLITPRAVCPTSTLLGMSPATQVTGSSVALRSAAAQGQGTPAATMSRGGGATSLPQGNRRALASGQGRAEVASAVAQAMPSPAQGRVAGAAARTLPSPAQGVGRAQAWIGIAFSCSNCSVVTEHGVQRWSFTRPPEVYSVETGSPAHTAGIRRGDVLTHVDDLSITSQEGGRRWASLEPGQTVRVRYVRSSNTRTATIRVAPPRAPAAQVQAAAAAELRELELSLAVRDSVTARLMRQYETALERQHAEQERMLHTLQQQLASGQTARATEMEQLLREHLRQQERMRAEHQQLLRETVRLRSVEAARSEASRRSLEELAEKVTTTRAYAVQPSVRAGDQRLRYSGTLRGTEVEVRGVNPVTVTERGNELVITTHDSTIIVRVPDRD